MRDLRRIRTGEGAVIEYSNSRILELITEWIHDSTHRKILRDRLVRGLTYEQIGELHHLSVSQVKRIVYRGQEKLFRHLN